MKLTKQLPARASLEQLKRQAKERLAEMRAPTGAASTETATATKPKATPILADAQLAVAREYGFASWRKLREKVSVIDLASDPLMAFIEAAVVNLDDHGPRDLSRAEKIRAAHGDVIGRDVFTAAILGDARTIRALVEANGDEAATEPGGLYDWDPLTYLAFSKYLRTAAAWPASPQLQGPEQHPFQFVEAARVLLDHGASANTGFYWQEHEPEPSLEMAIYGVSAIAQNVELTRLFLERGADVNDDETAYHVTETYQNDVLKVLLESGRFNADSLVVVLHRKLDWHDASGVMLALDHGADPNRVSRWGKVALEHALSRDNALPLIELLLDRGADPTDPKRITRTAARHGRADALRRLKSDVDALEDVVDRLIAACALDDEAQIKKTMSSVSGRDPLDLIAELKRDEGALLSKFAGVGNTEGVMRLLDLGLDVNAIWTEGFGYHEIAPRSTALHAASWLARHETVKLLISRGANVNAEDAKGRTPLMLAAKACTSSHWTSRKAPDSVLALLKAGADPKRADETFAPRGYEPVDRLLGRNADSQ